MTYREIMNMDQKLLSKSENGETLINEPCGCSACDDGVQPGHFACSQPSVWILEEERDGNAVRAYDDGAWRWYVSGAWRG